MEYSMEWLSNDVCEGFANVGISSSLGVRHTHKGEGSPEYGSYPHSKIPDGCYDNSDVDEHIMALGSSVPMIGLKALNGHSRMDMDFVRNNHINIINGNNEVTAVSSPNVNITNGTLVNGHAHTNGVLDNSMANGMFDNSRLAGKVASVCSNGGLPQQWAGCVGSSYDNRGDGFSPGMDIKPGMEQLNGHHGQADSPSSDGASYMDSSVSHAGNIRTVMPCTRFCEPE